MQLSKIEGGVPGNPAPPREGRLVCAGLALVNASSDVEPSNGAALPVACAAS
jgi:hypothetical protein